jgi:hypothetical protein
MPLNKRIRVYFYLLMSLHYSITPGDESVLSTPTAPEAIDINQLVSKLSLFKSRPKKNITTRSSTAQLDTAASFFAASKVSEILDNALYIKTHPAQFRNILQAPAFSSSTRSKYQTEQEYKTGKWGFNFFINRDDLKSYTASEENNEPTKLSSYLDLSSDTVLGAWSRVKNNPTVSSAITNFPEFDIPDLFSLFAPMRLQEHKIGVVAHYHTTWNNLVIDVKLPFLWAERNFNFTEEEKEKIYDNNLLKYFGEVDEWAFAKEYLISDQLGFGTLEATVSMDIITAERSRLTAGATLYIPTEYAVKKGLLGTYRELQSERPVLDFASLIVGGGGSATAGWQERLSDYFTSAFTQFTTNLLYTPLGFDKHPGIAFSLAPVWHINDRWTLKSDYSMTLLMAVKQNRLIEARIHYDREVTDLFAAAPSSLAKINIIESAMSERLFPWFSECLILPGAIFHSTSCFQRSRKKLTYMLGYDSWMQLREQILSHSLDRQFQYNIEKAEKPYAMQVKIFGKINKTIHTKKQEWNLSLYADYSLFNEALGKDFLINFEIQGRF